MFPLQVTALGKYLMAGMKLLLLMVKVSFQQWSVPKILKLDLMIQKK